MGRAGSGGRGGGCPAARAGSPVDGRRRHTTVAASRGGGVSVAPCSPRAAAATLAVAAAAAIIPASPLHRWVSRRHDDAPPHASPRGRQNRQTPSAPLASGLSIRAPRSLTVKFRRDQATGVIEITRSEFERRHRSVRAGAPRPTGWRAGQVSIDNQVPAQRYLIDLPASVQRFRIMVGHRAVMRWPEDSVRLTRGHETRQSGSCWTWRTPASFE